MSTLLSSYAEVLALAKTSQVVNWSRDSRYLSLVSDNLKTDRRTCVSVSFDRGVCGVIEVRTLCGYDPKKKCWGEYCSPSGTVPMPNKRGQKALLDWIRQLAEKTTGWPNPETFTHFDNPASA